MVAIAEAKGKATRCNVTLLSRKMPRPGGRGIHFRHWATNQIGSPTTDPALNGPVATVGGAVPEQTGLPYLSRR